ncbi:glycosyltransferase family 4 protein [Ciceribacter selenitireducens]
METQNKVAIDRSERILGLILGNEGYGVRRGWLSLLSGFRARGVPVSALVLQEGEIASLIRARGVEVTSGGLQPPPALQGSGAGKFLLLLKRAVTQLKAVAVVRREIRRSGAGTLLLRSPAEVLLAGLAARLSGIRAYWLMPNAISSGYPFDLNRRVYRFVFKHLNVVPIANSRFTDTTIGPGDFERHVCHLGISPAEFDPAVPGTVRRLELGIPEDAIVLGVFARMVAEKGQRRLAEALSDLGEQAARVHLLLCGGPLDSAYATELKTFVQGHGLAGRVHFTGPISDVASYYKICDVVVNSRLDPEPFGFSVIEGMMLGKPVLAHKAGGPGETVVDGLTGWHIEGPDRQAFVVALRRVLADLPRLAEIGQAARTHALANFTSDRMVGRLHQIFGGHNGERI